MVNIFILIIGVAIFAFSIVGLKEGLLTKKKSIFGIIIAAIVVILSSSFTIIRTGYTGVRTTFGQINESVIQRGFVVKIPFIQSVEKINNKQQDVKFKGEIWGEASDKTVVFASDVIVTYQINPEKSAYILSNVNNYKSNLIQQTLVNSAIKSAMIQLSSDTVTNRNKIEPIAKEKIENAITEKYGSDVITILKVTIDNMDFEDSYNQAIADKQIARQNAEKQAIENQKAVDLAKANQEKASVEAETKRIQAEADADAMRITAQAEADTYRIKSSEITENLLKKWELDARMQHGWVTIQGANTVVTGQ